jgi:hypothetical protein
LHSSEIKEDDLIYARDVCEPGNKYFLFLVERSNEKDVYGYMIHSSCKHWKNHYVSSLGMPLWNEMGDGTPYYEFHRLDGYGGYSYRKGDPGYWVDDDRVLRFD